MVKCKKALFFFSALLSIFCTSQASAVVDQDNQYVRYIDDITHNGITITKPGIYRFKKNVTVHFKEDDVAAIVVAAPNVVIDLNEYTLSQESNTANNIGIVIVPEIWSVTIKNGTIDGFSGFGIIAAPWTWALEMRDLRITSNGWLGGVELPDEIDHVGGILLDGSEAPVWDVKIDNCQVLWSGAEESTYDAAVDGLVAVGLIKGVITNSCFCDNWVNSNFANNGAEFFWAHDVTIADCHFDYLLTDTNPGMEYSHSYGVLFNSTGGEDYNANIKIRNCTANYMTGAVTEMGGFAFYNTFGLTVENCEADECYNSLDVESSTDYTAAAGFEFYLCQNFVVSDCKAGQHVSVNDTVSTVAGFEVAGSEFGVIRNCIAMYCQNDGGIGAGFLVSPYVNPIDSDRNIGIVFEECIAENNHGSESEDSPSGGFVLARADGAKIIDCEAIYNSPGGFTIGMPFDVEGSVDTINSVIKGNIAIDNENYGFLDMTGNDDEEGPRGIYVNAYIANLARSNGDTPLVDNYYYLPIGNNIVSWNLSGGINAPSNLPTDNISVY